MKVTSETWKNWIEASHPIHSQNDFLPNATLSGCNVTDVFQLKSLHRWVVMILLPSATAIAVAEICINGNFSSSATSYPWSYWCYHCQIGLPNTSCLFLWVPRTLIDHTTWLPSTAWTKENHYLQISQFLHCIWNLMPFFPHFLWLTYLHI